MIEFFLDIFMRFFSESFFGKLILRIFKKVKFLGLVVLKMITFSTKPIEDLKEKYKDSSKPYFIGFGLSIGLVYLVTKWLT